MSCLSSCTVRAIYANSFHLEACLTPRPDQRYTVNLSLHLSYLLDSLIWLIKQAEPNQSNRQTNSQFQFACLPVCHYIVRYTHSNSIPSNQSPVSRLVRRQTQKLSSGNVRPPDSLRGRFAFIILVFQYFSILAF